MEDEIQASHIEISDFVMDNLGFFKDVSIDVDVIDLDHKSQCKIEEKYWIANFDVEK